ncbi:ABC transporter permease [Bacillus massilinigeriensis]|uniref:ABC transporter permease n=1 Tax=Bacillus mediterraneensis TaxID=1805474 RepID=UPI000A9EE8B9|nr:ABC transporter permease [Bacillus mediterraneensis]
MNVLKNKRLRALGMTIFSILFLGGVVILGLTLDKGNIVTHLEIRNAPPTLEHLFGTDWLGRDMFTRTMMGLTLSMGVGLLGAFCSTMIAAVLGMVAATMGKVADAVVSWSTDLFLSVPHLVMLLLISFSLGGGAKGIIAGTALTHWPSLARIIRAEIMAIRSADYVQVSRRLGKPGWWIAMNHIFPHILPQLAVGFLLMFPHAILHEASVTFLGLGLSPHQPAIGIILSESMKYLSSGLWWLAFFPGLCLLFAVRAFAAIGGNLRQFIRPSSAHDAR